jgi:hypothetical protein
MRYAFSDGSHKYSGKSMIEAHARLFPMGLGGEEFDLVAGALVSTLQSINVPADIISDIVAVVSPLRSIFVDGRNNYLAQKRTIKTMFLVPAVTLANYLAQKRTTTTMFLVPAVMLAVAFFFNK